MRRILAAVAVLWFLVPAFAEPPNQQLRPIDDVEDPGEPPAPKFGPIPVASSLTRFNAAGVRVCEDREGGNCKTVRMPGAVGKVQRIVRGTFVSPAVASSSWLALTGKHASICYLSRAGIKVTCIPVLAKTPKDIIIKFSDNGANMSSVVFTPDLGMPAQMEEDMYRSVRTFARALDAASQKIQGHALEAQKTSASENNTPAAPMLLDPIGGGSCVGISGTCDSSDGSGGGNWASDSGFGADGAGGSDGAWWATPDGNVWESGWDSGVNTSSDGWEDNWGFPGADEFEADDHSDNDFPSHDYVFEEPVDVVTITGTRLLAQPSCVYGGFAVICTSPRQLPLIDPYEVQPPSGDSASGWNFCNTLGIFCSYRDDYPETDGLDKEEREARCTKMLAAEEALCSAQSSMGADYRTVRACNERAFQRYSQCLMTSNNIEKGK